MSVHRKDSHHSTVPLSVIIVSEMRRMDDIHACLQSLVEQEGHRSFEIIIVTYGDARIDLAPWIEKGLNIRMHRVTENNYCIKRNAGTREAEGDVVAYIDDDTILRSTWANAIIEGFRENWKMAGGRVEPLFETKVPKKLKGYERTIGGFNCLPEIGYATDTIIGCNMFFDRFWLADTGGFDEYIGEMNATCPKMFYGGDEVDVQARLRPSQVGFIPEAHVYHKIQESRMNPDYILKRAEGMGRVRYYIDQKNGLPRKRFFFRYVVLLWYLIRFRDRFHYRRKVCYIFGYFRQKHHT
jgi:glycosyltransferase involved in cell wall biosynthesis